MSRQIVLLRGVNVGGHNKLKMADFRSSLATAGFEGAQTYIQSGNIVLTSTLTCAQTTDAVAEILQKQFGISAPVLVRTAQDVGTIAAACPFSGDASRILIYFCFEPLEDFSDVPLRDLLRSGEELYISKEAIYLHAPDGISASKVAEKMDRLVPTQLTARNQRTVEKLIGLASAS